MQLLLYELEFHYVVGKKWHILADTAAVVSLRGTYIEYKLSNRRPTRRGKTWLLDDKTRYNKSGKGPRACIVAAGFISSKGGCVEAGFVGGSITYWNSTLKRKSLEDDDYHESNKSKPNDEVDTRRNADVAGRSTCKFQLEGNENQVDGACYAIKREANLHGSNHSIQV
ncbi:hypothetical protein PC118_g1821 [Phytophthora cactorum]|uniref:Uncharacterized protein n=1 Tax=Phytophthora cactorum TaxID=29920 RepID=A0A8T1DIT2_9STRA|nr:hypothetical protein PC111_g23104 [Phytophthora cactorum]KAG2839941.1 hypothetical protein PC112_g3943 [Phytophthora cactorum]KAG2874521.1 hypothetical protein PC114_g25227 [Phytophthora cactorum]KAG2941404.1 hypothetical protein PC115_g2009 [Phytophthora cactorum]KAG2997589.1 hypothetical protein PC118_g1821 [Phytophthora cactorum]